MAGFAAISAAGLLVYLFGSLEPWMFALCLFPATNHGKRHQNPGRQSDSGAAGEDTGSAVALIRIIKMHCIGSSYQLTQIS